MNEEEDDDTTDYDDNDIYNAVMIMFAPDYNDKENSNVNEGRDSGFPDCIGSINCIHWEWKTCASSWQSMFQGKSERPTVVLEADADHSCCFWHFLFGSPAFLDDINVIDHFPLIYYNTVNGGAPQLDCIVNGNYYCYAYWLVDGISSRYACFVKTFPQPRILMQKCLQVPKRQK
jgi:hypothetical protein